VLFVWLYKRGGKVYAEFVPDVKKKTLQALIRGHADLESVIHTDGWVAYDGWLIWAMKSTIVCSAEKMNFPKETVSSLTESKVFGTMPSISFQNAKAFRKISLNYT